MYLIGGSRGACPAHAPHGTQFFRFRIHFHRKVPTSEVHAPPLMGARPALREILDPPLYLNCTSVEIENKVASISRVFHTKISYFFF